MAAEVVSKREDVVEATLPNLELKVIADPTTGYAAIQNNIPVVRSLIV